MRCLLVTLALAACGGHGPHDRELSGMLGVPSTGRFAIDVLIADVTVAGAPTRLIVDTGSPFTIVSPTGVMLSGADADVTVGGVTVKRMQVTPLPITFGDAADGLLGGNLLCQFPTTFDYRAGAVRLGAAPPPADVELPGHTAAVHAEGGGADIQVTTSVRAQFLATRIPVTVTLEGVDHRFIVDTGASNTTVRSELFTTLVADQRHVLAGVPITTIGGTSTAQVARAHSLVAAGTEVQSSPLMASDAIDPLLDQLAAEVRHPVDGLLGGSFLREFLVTLDYPGGAMLLQRYGTRDHIIDEFQRVGVELDGSARVALVFPGTDAAAQLQLGDTVDAIDGVAPPDQLAADRALCGAPGTTKHLAVRRGATALSLDVRVDDLVPLP
jgi:predicted aspartyl protease